MTWVSAAVLTGLAVMTAVSVAASVSGSFVGMYTRDISALSAEAGGVLPPFAGAVSLLTIVAWGSIAWLSLVMAWLTRERQNWLIVFATFTVVLAIDDSLTLHERVGPSHGIPEAVFYASYALAAAYLTYGSLGRRTNSSTMPFLLGGLLLAGSLLADMALNDQYLVEDGLKLMGALVWLTVPVLCLPADARQRLNAELSEAEERTDGTA